MDKLKITTARGIAALLLAAAIMMAGCDTSTGGGGSKTVDTVTRLIRGKMGSAASQSIYRASRSVSRNVTPTDVDDVPFFLDKDPGGTAPAGMTALKGKVQAEGENGAIVIILTGVLDNESGKFVAAGVDSEDLGIGFQIEGVFKNNAVSGVKITVKTKEMEQTADFGEWVEEEITDWQDVNADVTATATADQEPGLPAAWTGKYKFNMTAENWADSLDGFYANRYPYTQTGDEGITLGTAAGEILADNDNVFVLIAPMAWSIVVNFDAMESAFRTKLSEKHFANVNEALNILKKRLGQLEKNYYCSFLEVAPGDTTRNETDGAGTHGEDPDAYYALAFNMWINLNTDGEDTNGEYFTRYKIYKWDDGIESTPERLILARANDLAYVEEGWSDDQAIPGMAATADEARSGSDFRDASGSIQWMFIQD
jgi:hypothetical protein